MAVKRIHWDNLDEFCSTLCEICYARKDSESLYNKVIQSIESLSDSTRESIVSLNYDKEKMNSFWSRERCSIWTKPTPHKEKLGKPIKIFEVIALAYAMYAFIQREYLQISHELQLLIMKRILPEDKVDGSSESPEVLERTFMTEFEGEMYLRRLYLTLKDQKLIKDTISTYVGSRQQCLYGCVCFILIFFGLYDSLDSANIPNIDWLKRVVVKGGCSLVLKRQEAISKNENKLLYFMADGEKKSIAMCVFDLVNTKNPSGGMIGPGNCLWLHNLMLTVCGSVGEWYKKLIKNHACIHDACGFVMTFHEISPGYIYGLFSEALKISSDGAKRGGFNMFFSSWCCMGQFSG